MININNSKENILEFGEVFTSEKEVNKMLNLVSEETCRIDSRFLEPACGDGNFLIEVLNRKLSVVKEIYHKNQHDFEKYSFIAVANIYGVDIRNENVLKCRERLSVCFEKFYLSCYKTKCNPTFVEVIKFVLSKNILYGDAITLKVPNSSQPVVFSEWSLAVGNIVTRTEYALNNLLESKSISDLPLFSDLGEEQFLPEPLRKYPAVNYMDLSNELI